MVSLAFECDRYRAFGKNKPRNHQKALSSVGNLRECSTGLPPGLEQHIPTSGDYWVIRRSLVLHDKACDCALGQANVCPSARDHETDGLRKSIRRFFLFWVGPTTAEPKGVTMRRSCSTPLATPDSDRKSIRKTSSCHCLGTNSFHD